MSNKSHSSSLDWLASMAPSWHSPVNLVIDCLGCDGDRKPGEIPSNLSYCTGMSRDLARTVWALEPKLLRGKTSTLSPDVRQCQHSPCTEVEISLMLPPSVPELLCLTQHVVCLKQCLYSVIVITGENSSFASSQCGDQFVELISQLVLMDSCVTWSWNMEIKGLHELLIEINLPKV